MASPDAAFALIAAGISHCSGVVAEQGGLLTSLLFTGLVGGVSHCIGMCGPFVLSQVGSRLERIPAARMREWHRLTGGGPAAVSSGADDHLFSAGGRGGNSGGPDQQPQRPALAVGGPAAAGRPCCLPGTPIPRLRQLWHPSVPVGTPSAGRWINRVAAPLFCRTNRLAGLCAGDCTGVYPPAACCMLLWRRQRPPVTRLPVPSAWPPSALAPCPTCLRSVSPDIWPGSAGGGLIAQAAPVLLILNAGVLAWLAVSLIA